jgi:mono/diheme cytochrome c family protein
MKRAAEKVGILARWDLALIFALALSGCTKDSDLPAKRVQGGDARRGKALYLSNCAACHNSDPSKDGPVGPAVKGSSEALIEARLLRASYPSGYTPKRKTSAMPAQPYLKSTIPDLAAFLR